MQTTKLRTNFIFTTNNKSFIRSVTAIATNEKGAAYKNVTSKSWREIPGPTSLPLLGATHHFFPGGIFHKFGGLELATKLYETYGPIVRIDNAIGRDPQLFIFDAEATAQILRGENWTPTRPSFEVLEYYRRHMRKDVKKIRPTGLLTEHGDEWKDMRSVVNPVMLKPNIIKLYTKALDAVAKDMVVRLQSQRDETNRLKTNFNNEMGLWTLESIGIVALGCRIGGFNPNLSEDSPSQKLINIIHEMLKLIEKLEFNPTLWKVFPTTNFKRAMVVFERQEILAKYFINNAIKEFKKENNRDEEKSILEKLLEINEDLAMKMASDMLFAGVDTTTNTITGTLYLLAVNPEKQTKLREELRSNDNKRTYLKACVKESLRLMPVSPGMRRITTKEYDVLGYRIPAQMYIHFGQQLMSLMEKHYPRNEEFLPERWLVKEDDPLHYRHAHSFAHAPFGSGVRNCIARRIAELMLELFTARMVESFQMELSGPPPIVQETFINYVKEPYNFIFKDAPK